MAFWKRGIFTVPATTSRERVELVADKYMARFGNALEKEGYTVLRMTEPKPDTSLSKHWVDPDRIQYVMWALIEQRPFEIHFDVEDELVPEMVKLGLKLTE